MDGGGGKHSLPLTTNVEGYISLLVTTSAGEGGWVLNFPASDHQCGRGFIVLTPVVAAINTSPDVCMCLEAETITQTSLTITLKTFSGLVVVEPIYLRFYSVCIVFINLLLFNTFPVCFFFFLIRVTGFGVFSFNELKRITRNFDDRPLSDGGNKIGEGGFGVVFQGQLKSEKVAVKKLTTVCLTHSLSTHSLPMPKSYTDNINCFFFFFPQQIVDGSLQELKDQFDQEIRAMAK